MLLLLVAAGSLYLAVGDLHVVQERNQEGMAARTRLSVDRLFPGGVPRLALAGGRAARGDQGRSGNRAAAVRDGP
jgi:hypothetical protein